MYAGAGYAVVYSNPRGSSGYSEAWGRAIMGPGELGPGWGTVDYQDLMAVADEALKRFDFCDPERMGVLGGSYGGFMTSWIVEPHRPLQGRVLGTRREQPRLDVRLERHRLGLQGLPRHLRP